MLHLPESSPLPPLSGPGSKVGRDFPLNYGSARPTGVTALALLNFVCAGLSIFLVARVLLSPEVSFSPGYELVPGFPQVLLITTGSGAMFVGIAGTVICLPMAIGLWRLRQWARVMALIVYIGGVAVTLCANLSSPITGSTLISLIISATAAYYLLQPQADQAFGKLSID